MFWLWIPGVCFIRFTTAFCGGITIPFYKTNILQRNFGGRFFHKTLINRDFNSFALVFALILS